MRALLLCFSVLVVLVIFWMYVNSVPRLSDTFHAILAAIFILFAVVWFAAEMAWGGGDPNK